MEKIFQVTNIITVLINLIAYQDCHHGQLTSVNLLHLQRNKVSQPVKWKTKFQQFIQQQMISEVSSIPKQTMFQTNL